MSDSGITDIGELQTHGAKTLRFQQIDLDGDITMLRMRILEGKRITDLELVPETARQVAALLTEWADRND